MALTPAAAHAQEFGPLLGTEIPFETNIGKNVGVSDRPRPELDPLGIRAGGFLIFPQVTGGVGYTSNAYGSLTDKKSDAFFTFRPDVSIQSQWSRNYLSLDVNGDFKRFANQTLKNENGYTILADGRLDMGESNKIEGIATYQRNYEEQYSGSFPANAAGSVPYTRATGILRGTWQLNRVRLIANVDVNQFNFSSIRLLSGDVISLRFRDRTDVRGSGRAEYAVSPNTAAFVESTYLASNYNHEDLANGQRSSHELRVLGGFTFDVTSLVRANLGLGIVRRNYDNPVFGQINTVAADAQISYFVDGLTTITLGGRRDVQDAIQVDTPGYISSRLQLRVDHELLRNLLPYIEGDYEHDKFKNVTRRDDLYSVEVGADYKANRTWEAEPALTYIKRNSDGEPIGEAFDEVRILLKLTAKL